MQVLPWELWLLSETYTFDLSRSTNFRALSKQKNKGAGSKPQNCFNDQVKDPCFAKKFELTLNTECSPGEDREGR